MDAHGQRQHAVGALALAVALTGCGGYAFPDAKTTLATSKAKVAPSFLEDDYARALATAKAQKKLLFVDAWATWCHSCQSMRAYVLSDPALAAVADDFVWLAIDTEKESNQAFTAKLTNRVWPTLYVVDPTNETAVMRWEGTATAPELVSLLGVVRSRGEASAGDADAFRAGTALAAKGDRAGAERAFLRAIEVHDENRPRALEALIGILEGRKDWGACSALAAATGPELPPGTSRVTVLATGLQCAREAKHETVIARLSEAAEKTARDPDPRIVADDRSALYEELVDTRDEKGDHAGAKALAHEWATYLEGEAKRAPSKSARAVFDAHRLSAYIAAGEPERAIPMLEESEKDFPTDYNPPARLARAYLEMKRLDEATRAIERAAARVYGPRALRVFAVAADIAKARGDVAAERNALAQAIARTPPAVVAVMNDGQKKLRGDLEKRLAGLR